jgi:hypothetical protein
MNGGAPSIEKLLRQFLQKDAKNAKAETELRYFASFAIFCEKIGFGVGADRNSTVQAWRGAAGLGKPPANSS